jgi:hypothetical protein
MREIKSSSTKSFKEFLGITTNIEINIEINKATEQKNKILTNKDES